MKRKLPTIVPPSNTATFHRPTIAITLRGNLFNPTSFSSWQPKPAQGNQLLTGTARGHDCVLKVFGGGGDNGTPASLHRMFRTEVEALTKLRNCCYVVNLVHADDQAFFSEHNRGFPTVLTERCHLGNLSMLIPSRGGLPIVFARSLFDQLISAVAYCHLHRIAHTDICLENMLLHESGELKLTGFARSKIGGGAHRLDRSHVLDREKGARSSTSTLGRYAWPPELRAEAAPVNQYDGLVNLLTESNSDSDSDASLSDDELDNEILVELHEKSRKRKGKNHHHDISKYDAYAGDVWSSAVCLLVMCTGRAPFVSLSIPLSPEQVDNKEKPIDWALNAWHEGKLGQNRFWDMLVSLQPTLLQELTNGFDDLLNGMMNVDAWYRTSAKDVHAHRWTRTSGNKAKPHTIRTYMVQMIHPTLHGVSGHDGSVELKQTAAMVRAQEEFSQRMIGTEEQDNREQDNKAEEKDNEMALKKKHTLGNNGLSFYQANVYAIRNAKRTAVEQIRRMNQTGKKQINDGNHPVDETERSALAQLGVQRAKQLAAEDNDVIYPHLETMWSKALGKQIMVRMPPIVMDDTGVNLKPKDAHADKSRHDKVPSNNLKELEKKLIEGSKDLINLYLRDDQTVLDIKKIMATRVVEEFPARWFDYATHTLCLCGKPLPDDLIIGTSTVFNRGNTVFRLFPTDRIPTNASHKGHRARIKEGKAYVHLFDYLHVYDQLNQHTSLPQVKAPFLKSLNSILYDSDKDEEQDREKKEEELFHETVRRTLIVRSILTGRLPVVEPRALPKQINVQKAMSALRLLSNRMNHYKIKHELSSNYIADPWCEKITGPEFIKMAFRLREEEIAKEVFQDIQRASTKQTNNSTVGSTHTRFTKGTVITALHENIQVRKTMVKYPEMELLYKGTRDTIAEAIRTMKTEAGSRLMNGMDLLLLMRMFGAPNKKKTKEEEMGEADEEDGEEGHNKKEQKNSSIHYLSWKNALETQNYAWRFTGKHSKAAEAKRRENRENEIRREKRRLEQQTRLEAKRLKAEVKRNRKEQIRSTLKARYGVLSDYFSEFGLAPARMDYRKFMAHCVDTYRNMALSGERVGKHWGEAALTGEYIVKYNTQNYRNLQGVKAQASHLRRVDKKNTGLITLVEFIEALKNMEWVHNYKSAEEAHGKFVVDDIF